MTRTTYQPQTGDTVTYVEFGTPRTYTVTALVDGGLRVRLDDGLGDLGYAVNVRECTLVKRAEVVEAVPAQTTDSPDFPTVGAEMTWTRVDGAVSITVRRTAHTFTVETYRGVYRVEGNCGAYATEAEARRAARGYAELYQAETPAPALTLASRPTPQAHPAAKGTLTKVTDPQQLALTIAARDGIVLVTADTKGPTLRAAAKRGYLDPVNGDRRRPYAVTGATITDAGRRRLAQLVQAGAGRST